MKTIRLTPQQRKDIGERRRHAPDRRIYQRLSAVLWSDDGRTREEIADLLGVSTRQVGQWLRIFRNKGLDRTLHPALPGRSGPPRARPGRAAQAGDRQGGLPQRRAGPHLGRGDLRRGLLDLGPEGPAPPDRGQLPQGLRLLLEGRCRGAEAVGAEAPAAQA